MSSCERIQSTQAERKKPGPSLKRGPKKPSLSGCAQFSGMKCNNEGGRNAVYRLKTQGPQPWGWGGEDWLWRQPLPDLPPNATLPEVTTSKPRCLCRQFRDSEPFLAVLELGGSGGCLAVTHFQMPGKRQACGCPSKVSVVRRAVLAHHVTAHPHPIHQPPPTRRCGHTWTLSIHPNCSNPESHVAV